MHATLFQSALGITDPWFVKDVAGTRYAQRNRAMVLTSVWSGMRVGEISALRVGDVVNADGTVKNEIRLTAEQTKGRYPPMSG